MDEEEGFDCEFVKKPSSDIQSECPVCLQVICEPYQVDCCGYVFCQVCIKHIKATKVSAHTQRAIPNHILRLWLLIVSKTNGWSDLCASSKSILLQQEPRLQVDREARRAGEPPKLESNGCERARRLHGRSSQLLTLLKAVSAINCKRSPKRPMPKEALQLHALQEFQLALRRRCKQPLACVWILSGAVPQQVW